MAGIKKNSLGSLQGNLKYILILMATQAQISICKILFIAPIL